MAHLLEYSTAWGEFSAHIAERESCIIVAPQHYGKRTVLLQFAKSHSNDPDTRTVSISSRIPTLDGDLDYGWLWDTVRTQVLTKRRIKVRDRLSFLDAITEAVQGSNYHTRILVGGEGRGHEESHYKVLFCLQRLLASGKASVLATDDYSSFYFQKQGYLLSDLHSFGSVQVIPASVAEIRKCISDRIDRERTSLQYVEEAAVKIREFSGGHIGLAEELLGALQREGWPSLGTDLNACFDQSIKRSHILESISKALEEDAVGYSRTALEYRIATCPEQNSPRIHVLRQLGVLQRSEPSQLRLCEGAITKLVEGLWSGLKAASHARLGTIVSETGPSFFEQGPVELTDDDIVVVHLSDLHVGDNYKHRLTWSGGQLNPNEHSAAELLKDDLDSLGLLKRVDALVISGDIVGNGNSTEFRRAQSVVEEIVQQVEVDLSKVMLIPGNHDIEWNPGPLASMSFGKPVSRESFDDFLKLLGKSPSGEIFVIEIESRSGKHRLRLIGLDSNRVESPEGAGIGFVSRESLAAGKKAVADGAGKSSILNWAVLHHHVFPGTSASLVDAQRKAISITANAAEILGWATQLNIEVILHGHEHQPCVTVARRWPVDVANVFSPIASIGAGSFGVKREYLGPFSRNHYYVIIRRPKGILIRSREQGAGGVKFVPHSDMWLPR